MKAEDLKQSILQYAIQGKLSKQNIKDNSASIYLKELKKGTPLSNGKKISYPSKISDEEKYFDIPSNWEWVRLGYLVKVKQYETIAKRDLLSSGYPVYGANGIIGYTDTYNHAEPTLLLTCRGATCGATNISQEYSYINGNAFSFDKIDSCLDMHYLKLFFDGVNLKNKGVITGSAQPQITQQNLLPFLIPVPPLEEQKRIVAKVEILLKKIDVYSKYEHQLSEFENNFPNTLKQSIMQYAIQGKLSKQNIKDKSSSTYLKELKKGTPLSNGKNISYPSKISDEEKYFDIPSNWEWVRLGYLVKVKQYETIAKRDLLSSGYPVYGANGIIGYTDTYNHAEPTLLLTCRGATCGATNISQEYSYINGNAFSFDKIDSCLDMNYLKLFFDGVNLKNKGVITGSAQPQITQQNLLPFLIPVPPLEEQKRIISAIEDLFEKIDNGTWSIDSI